MHYLLVLFGLLAAPFAHGVEGVTATFVPEQIFAGNSHGTGYLKLGLGKARPFTVQSHGTLQADGRLQLDQVVRFVGKPEHKRSWIIWNTGAGHYSATLSDAAGPVLGRAVGSRFTLRYPLSRWGLVMHQTLDLATDRRSIANVARIRWLGLPVGKLKETITIEH